MNYINEHSFYSMCSKGPHTYNLRRSHHWTIITSIMSEVKVKPSLHQALSQNIDAANCVIHALLHNTPSK